MLRPNFIHGATITSYRCEFPCCSTSECRQLCMQFTPASSPRPSLRSGWVLDPKKDKVGSVVELLLLRPGPRENHFKERKEGNVMHEELSDSGTSGRIAEDKGGVKLVSKSKYVKGADVDRTSFIRVYYLSALRARAEDCHELAKTLKGHLLNWPRVKNVARVAGDDVDEDLESLFPDSKEWKKPTGPSMRAAVYGVNAPTIRKSVRANGTGKDRSTTPTKGLRSHDSKSSARPREEDQSYAIDLVEEGRVSHGQCSTSGRMGGCHDSNKWRGPTRLLLLAEGLVEKSPSELPSTVQCLCSPEQGASARTCELVTCRLTLFYEYWSFDEVLEELLPIEVQVPDARERIGHVLYLNLSSQHLPFRHLIAQVALDKYKPEVRSVVYKTEVRHGKSYSVQLELLAGTRSLVTTAWEYGRPFQIDLASVIWDSRLSFERQRLVQTFSKDDVVCDIFAGAGPVVIAAGNKVRRVFANDANPIAFAYLAKNVVKRKLAAKVEIFNQDPRCFLSKIFDPNWPLPITQVVMSYPSSMSLDLLEFLGVLLEQGTYERNPLPRIHVYLFSKNSDPEGEVFKEIMDILGVAPHDMNVIRVTEIAPEEWLLAASFTIPAPVGFRDEHQLQERVLT